MSVTNGERLVTKQDLADFYNDIRPYMGGLVTSKAGFTPIGTIISVMGTTAPVNYLACDGTVYNIADYVELANYFNEQFGSKNFFGGNGTTTFAVPDLRGEFLRGTGTNSHANQGSGASVGVHQNSTRVPNVFGNYLTGGQSLLITGQSLEENDGVGKDVNAYRVLNGTMSTDSSSMDLMNIRPTNTSVLYCIATKNFYIDPTLDYSTDEKIVGTWIDGEPIYQKTFFLTTLPTPSSSQNNMNNYSVLHGISNIKCIINQWGEFNQNYSGTIVSRHISSAGVDTEYALNYSNLRGISIYALTRKDDILFNIGTDGMLSAFVSLHYTIQYTKTTT